MFGHAGDHVSPALCRGRWGAQLRLPHQIVVAADTAGGDDHGLGAQREVARDLPRTAFSTLDRVQARGSHPLMPSTVPPVIMSASTRCAEFEGQPPGAMGLARAPLERFDNSGAGAPGDMKPAAPNCRGPWRRSRRARPSRPPERSGGPWPRNHARFFARREGDVGLRPAPRPQILAARSKPARSHPVLQREVVTVLDAEPALFRRIDQKKPAKRPKGLAAQALFALLIDHDDAFAGVGNLGCGDEAREGPRRPTITSASSAIAFPRAFTDD